jgi:valyl-tRNA synthetase
MGDKTLPKGYEPREVEAAWASWWEENLAFTPDPRGPGEPYSIVIPPPNVTGALHMGHALNITLQDILCRFHRQQGRKVLWVPGMDHAGIATQNVVERKLKSEGVLREDLGREKFLEKVWEWKEEYGGRILAQIRRLGASVDWTRERFTMDQGLSRAVREVFVRLYEDGLVYRGEYIINWCIRCRTALADDEVEYSPKKSRMYEIRYPLSDGSGDLVVATVRPETMLGDTAVAVNPDDDRWAHAVGKEVELPLTGRRIPVIADTYVDMEFGTGCLKVTPAHDMNDWELGRKHELAVVRVIDDAGMMTAEAGAAYAGLDMITARARVVEDLEAAGRLAGVADYEHKVSECYRCKTVIEPNVSKQWFVAVGKLAAAARKAVETGETTIHPAGWAKTYYDWLDNIRDWCISRQLWWGHRIPVWYCRDCEEVVVSRQDPEACPCGGGLTQDPDVLDTWFSSALWPFSTLGWPDQTPELETFYPTSVLVTGFDILFFWVARMMMMGIYNMEAAPFADVYLHALVRDEEGVKMSKSLGNIIDPLDMVDTYGCDSLRFTLTAFAAMGRDIKLSEARIEGYRHFVNKIWNAARFALMNLPETVAQADAAASGRLAHIWVLHRLESVKEEVASALAEYRFNDAAQTLYQFTWHEFCDWYLEMAKPEMNAADQGRRDTAAHVLWTVLSELLVVMHPIMPFVTQEIWSHLPDIPAQDISRMPYPEARPERLDSTVEGRMKLLQDVVVSVRNIRGELNITPSLPLDVLVRAASQTDKDFIEACADLVGVLARAGSVTVETELSPPKASASAVIDGGEVFVPLSGAVDLGAELARLEKEEAKLAKDLEIVGRKLANEDFVAKAPAEVVAKERDKAQVLSEKKEKIGGLRQRLASMQ